MPELLFIHFQNLNEILHYVSNSFEFLHGKLAKAMVRRPPDKSELHDAIIN
jgi:hypothetical protein